MLSKKLLEILGNRQRYGVWMKKVMVAGVLAAMYGMVPGLANAADQNENTNANYNNVAHAGVTVSGYGVNNGSLGLTLEAPKTYGIQGTEHVRMVVATVSGYSNGENNAIKLYEQFEYKGGSSGGVSTGVFTGIDENGKKLSVKLDDGKWVVVENELTSQENLPNASVTVHESKDYSLTIGKTEKTEEGYFQTNTITSKDQVSGLHESTSSTRVQTGDVVTANVNDKNVLTITVNGETQAVYSNHYFSVNSNMKQTTDPNSNYDNSGATGVDSMAVGAAVATKSMFATVVGNNSKINAFPNKNNNYKYQDLGSTVMGAFNQLGMFTNNGVSNTKPYDGTNSSIIGMGNYVYSSNSALAIGTGNTISSSYVEPANTAKFDAFIAAYEAYAANPSKATNEALQKAAQAYANDSNSFGGNAVAIGTANSVSAKNSQAIGVKNSVGSYSDYANVNGSNNSLSYSEYSNVIGYKNVLKGTVNKTDKDNPINIYPDHENVMGSENEIQFANHGVVIGSKNVVRGSNQNVSSNNLVIGDENIIGAKSYNANQIHVIQNNTVIGEKNTVQYGNDNMVFGDNHQIVGTASKAYSGNIIIGNASATSAKTTKASNAVVIGTDAYVTKDNGVALGANSAATVDAGVAGYDPLTSKDSTLTTATWQSKLAAVSVGDTNKTRQITNVAAGSKDTDAVNVAQLKQAVQNDIKEVKAVEGTGSTVNTYTIYRNDGTAVPGTIVDTNTKNTEANITLDGDTLSINVVDNDNNTVTGASVDLNDATVIKNIKSKINTIEGDITDIKSDITTIQGQTITGGNVEYTIDEETGEKTGTLTLTTKDPKNNIIIEGLEDTLYTADEQYIHLTEDNQFQLITHVDQVDAAWDTTDKHSIKIQLTGTSQGTAASTIGETQTINNIALSTEVGDVNSSEYAGNFGAGTDLVTAVNQTYEEAMKHTTVVLGEGEENLKLVEGTNTNKGIEYTLSLNKDIKAESITTESITIEGSKVEITKDGINAGDQTITNVADGKVEAGSKDAVNGGQLFETKQEINNNINKLGNRVNKVGARSAALAALHPLEFDPDDKLSFAAGYGNYKGESAAAIGAFYRPDEKVMISVAGTMSDKDNMINAGVSFSLDRTPHRTNTKTAMAKEIVELRERLAQMEQFMMKQQGFAPAAGEMKLFPDVPENHWAYEYVKGLQEQGVLEGYPDGSFAGDRMCTRYEFAAMLYRAMQRGANLDSKIIKEFEPELCRVRVDLVHGEANDYRKVERVRVNTGVGKDKYGNKIQVAAK